nr:unnamed protein product [Callosobruchus analis]
MSEEEKTLKLLRHQRGISKRQLTIFKTFVEDFDLDNGNLHQLKKRLEKIEQCWDEFSKCQLEIELIETDDEYEAKERDLFERNFFEITSKAQQIIDNRSVLNRSGTFIDENIPSSEHQLNTNSKTSVKLPDLNLPTFDGNYTEYLQFPDSFSALIHNNNRLSNVEKLHYLRSCLRGEAAKVVCSLKTTDANYSVAWQLIKERFEDKRTIVNQHLKCLFELPNIHRSSAEALRQFSYNVVKEIRCLESLGEPINTWDSIMLYLLSSKIDNGTRLAWEMFLENNSNTTPTLEEFLTFLKSRCHTLENVFSNPNQRHSLQLDRYNKQQMINRLWKLKIDWNDYIPDQLSLEFSKFVNDLKNLKAVSIPRHVLLPSSNLIIELHGFADASQFAYGACVYLRCSNNQNEVKTSMLSAKSRVAPLKSQTIPRLELCGALLLSRLIDKIMKNIKLDINQVILYSDSTIVLAWLAREPAELKTFVSNRVSEILELTSKYKWQHVLSNDNPADIIPRGCKTTDLANNSLWLLGPPWLSNDHLLERQYPEMSEINEIPELKRITHLHISTEIIELDIFSRFSSLNKLLHVTAFCMRFIENCKSPKPNRNLNKSLLIPEIEDATVRLIRLIQSQLLYDDIDHLKRFNCVPKKSKIRCLHPFMDENQILRVGGRLRHSEIPFNHKFPILLPSNHAFVTLLIRHEHSKTLHGGVQTVLSSIRLQYWIINGKNAVRKVLRRCVTCFRARPRSFAPIMGDLPSSRVTPARPFFNCGVDFAGPFLIKDGTLRSRNDSTIVLAWLAREPAELKTFVSNRVSEILELTSKYKWQHVLSNDNPADIIPRGCKTTDLANNSLWLLGPPWLSNDHLLERQYPEMSEINEIPELKRITHLHISTEIIELDIFSRFSSLNKLLHVTAFCMRFIENCKSPKPNRNLNKSLLIPEIEDATVRLIRLIQSQLLYDDIDHLKRFNCVPKKSKIRCLHPFMDENQILRVGGRLRHSEIPFNHKFPILLPSNHAFVTLLIRHEHSKTLHGGVQTVLSSIRLQYWIINGKNAVRKVLRRCVTCFRARPRSFAPIMGDLPSSRVTPARPFFNCGVDFAGPFLIKDGTLRSRNDSTIVLAWLAREPAELKTFVSNRVSEILELTSKYKWQHVLSNDNPADIIPRGCKTTDLANNSLWLLGPPWLSNDHLLERQYPEMSEINEIPELKRITHLHISTEIIELDIFSRFSSLNKLLHVTAFCMRFIENCKSPKPNRNLNKSLLIPEIEDATVRLIRLIQSQLLYDDIDHLKRFNCVPKKSKIRCLHPFMDENQILRVGGRLRHSEIPFNHKFPILLPSNHAFVTLLIRHEHSKTLHGGVQTVLSSIRLQYWIINGKNAVRKVLRRCVTCFRARPRSFAPIMGDLPSSRVTPARPFFNCGVDFAGPFLIKDGTLRSRKLVKAYVCIFICFVTKLYTLNLSVI